MTTAKLTIKVFPRDGKWGFRIVPEHVYGLESLGSYMTRSQAIQAARKMVILLSSASFVLEVDTPPDVPSKHFNQENS